MLFEISPIKAQVTPFILQDLHSLIEYMQTYYISADLKQYRPQRKPLTGIPEEYKDNMLIKHKRRMIVRDWFFFIVWYVRLKKLLKNIYNENLLEKELQTNPDYTNVLKLLENPNMTMSELKSKLIKTKTSLIEQALGTN